MNPINNSDSNWVSYPTPMLSPDSFFTSPCQQDAFIFSDQPVFFEPLDWYQNQTFLPNLPPDEIMNEFSSSSQICSQLQHNHQDQMIEKKVFTCPTCQKSFNSKQSLKSHSTTHLDAQDKPFECTLCGSSFRRKHDLTRHHRSLHATIKPFKCRFCDRQYARSDALKRHLMSKAHSIPAHMTMAVTAASRQTAHPSLIWPPPPSFSNLNHMNHSL